MVLDNNALLMYDRALCADAGLVGVDEAGRGALAGPVVAAAAWVKQDFYDKEPEECKKVRDSKTLPALTREKLFNQFVSWEQEGLIAFSWAQASVVEIDVCNILGATHLAMRRALDVLASKLPKSLCLEPQINADLDDNDAAEWLGTRTPLRILVDGPPVKPFDYKHEGVISGDKKSFAIALASIVAKVSRDCLMLELDSLYPAYGFAKHKGYGTPEHSAAILKHGQTDEHRSLFLTKLFSRRGKE